jgi:transcriptional regulator with XRE-family HTH domain
MYFINQITDVFIMLKVFQLRVARSTLGLGVRDIGAYINLSRSTISKIERMDVHSELNITYEQNTVLLKIFNDKGVLFDVNSVSLKNINCSLKGSITRFQLRGGRAILGFSQRELAELIGMKKSDLNYLENLDNTSYISTKKIEINQSKINILFENNGIVFPDDGTILIKKN